ncbi:MAG: hypothetical protein ACI4O0_07635 [Candidatus Limivicinus sp.]
MKQRTKRFLASLLAALTLIAPLTAPAYADDAGTAGDESPVSAQPEASTDQTVTPAAEGASGTIDGTVPLSEDDAPGTGEADTGDTGDAGTEDTGETLVTTFSANSYSTRASDLAEGEDEINPLTNEESSTEGDTTPVVKIGDTTLGTDATDACWDKVNGNGWRYDGSAVSMVNNGSALEVHAEGAGIDLSLAGFNRISTLYADGDVNITGTGILLIDEIDMLEGTNLNLLTNTAVYTDGSVAVFKKTADGVYELINGNVTGILDEEYTIPEGITLVVPDGGTLDMRVTTEVTITTKVEYRDGTDPVVTTETHYGFTADDNNNMALFEHEQATLESGEDGISKTTIEKREASFFTPVLNIATKAALKIQEGAKLLMQSFQSFIGFRDSQYSTLNVSGTLELEGTIEAYANSNDGNVKDFVLNVESGGHVTGSGTMTDVAAFYKEGAGKQDELNLAGSSYVTVDSSGIGSLNSKGTTSVIYADGVSMGSVTAGESGSVTFYGKGADSQLEVSGSVTGPYTISSGYLTIGGNFANESFSNITTGGDYIPFGFFNGVKGSGYPSTPFYAGYVSDSNTSKVFQSPEYGPALKQVPTSISYDSLIANIYETFTSQQSLDYFEVYTRDSQGKVTLHLLSKNSTETVDPSQVFLIRGISFALIPINESGSGIGSTNTSNTGSGILGGENAGSFPGGNSNPVLGGNRQPPSPPVDPGPDPGPGTDPDPEPGTDPDPEPGTDPDPEPGTDPDPEPGTDPDPAPDPKPEDKGEADVPTAAAPWEGTSHDLIVKVSDAGADYRVDAFRDGVALQELDGGTVHVAMEVRLEDGWNADDLFVVFRGDKGELVAVKASYDPTTGMLVFESPLLGQFQLLCFHWEGTDYESPAFLAALQAYMN